MNQSDARNLIAEVKGQLFAFDLFSSFFKTPSMTEYELFVAWSVFEEKLKLVGFDKSEQKRIFNAFIISYVGHLYAEKRKSGEAYFYHLFRSGMKILYDQIALKIRDEDAVITILLHDVIEEAESSETILMNYKVIITRKILVTYFGEKRATMVSWLSRKKWQSEGRIEHLERVASSDLFQVPWGKLTDIRDNFDTLASMPLEKQKSKFREAKEKVPDLLNRLEFLVLRGLENGTLSGDGWLKLRTRIERGLRRSIRKQKKRLLASGVEIA